MVVSGWVGVGEGGPRPSCQWWVGLNPCLWWVGLNPPRLEQHRDQGTERSESELQGLQAEDVGVELGPRAGAVARGVNQALFVVVAVVDDALDVVAVVVAASLPATTQHHHHYQGDAVVAVVTVVADVVTVATTVVEKLSLGVILAVAMALLVVVAATADSVPLAVARGQSLVINAVAILLLVIERSCCPCRATSAGTADPGVSLGETLCDSASGASGTWRVSAARTKQNGINC